MFEPTRQTVADLYNEPKSKYVIPRYQREYSWGKEQLEEFWKLLVADEPTFLGSVIFFVDPDETSPVKEIIDGQQRHITTSIFAAALRDYLVEEAKASRDQVYTSKLRGLAEDIQRLYIGRRRPLADENDFDYYLTPGVSTQPYFGEHIQRFPNFFSTSPLYEIKLPKGKTVEEKLIQSAYRFFKDRISEYSGNDAENCLRLHGNLAKHVLIRIEIEDYSVANEIFESVNDKGLSLSVSDLIKNQVLRHFTANSNEEEDALNSWMSMISNVEMINFKPREFLRYFWASKFEYVPDKKLYKAIKKKFSNDVGQWKSLVFSLETESEVLSNLFNWTQQDCVRFTGNYRVGRKFYYSLRVIRSSSSKTWAVLLLSLVRNIEKLNGFNFDIGRHMSKLHEFIFLYFDIMQNPGNWFFSVVCEAAAQIEAARTAAAVHQTFKDLYDKFRSRLDISFQPFADSLRSLQYADKERSRSQIRYILGEYEFYLRGEIDEGWDEDKVNIEHFVPRVPTNWGLTTQQSKRQINQLGNLVLIPEQLNGRLGNRNCEEKLRMIEQSASSLRQLTELTEKTRSNQFDFLQMGPSALEAIDQRQNELSIAAYEIWVKRLRKNLGGN